MIRLGVVACGLLALIACGESPTGGGGPATVRVRLVLEGTAPAAVVVRVAGPAFDGVEASSPGLVIETRQFPQRWMIAAFGDAPVSGPIATLLGVDPRDATLLDARVLEAADENNRPLDAATVMARIVIDTLR